MSTRQEKFSSYRIFSILIVISIFLLITGCAGFRTSTQVTVEKPPYYYKRTFSSINLKSARVGHLPVVLDRMTYNEKDYDLWKTLLGEINGFLRDQGWTIELEPIELPMEEAPDLFVGYSGMFGAPVAPSSFSDQEGEEEQPQMVIYYKNPSEKWKKKLLEITRREKVEAVLFLSVGLSEYLIRQKNWLGKKELALGTGYSVPMKWLSSLDDPIDVLHFTGCLMDRNGKIYRVGAEGIVAARPASFFESIIGFRNSLSYDTIRKITTEIKRTDLKGAPLSYRVALQNLVASLLGRKDMIIK